MRISETDLQVKRIIGIVALTLDVWIVVAVALAANWFLDISAAYVMENCFSC